MTRINGSTGLTRWASGWLVVAGMGALSGCALHADVVELNKEMQALKGAQEQAAKSQAQIQDRLKEMEARLRQAEARPVGGGGDSGISQARFDELSARLKDLETKVAHGGERPVAVPTPSLAAKVPAMPPADLPKPEPSRQSKPVDLGPTAPESDFMIPGTPEITPTSAFNLAYNDYLNGRYELAVSGFQRFLKDFPATSLTPSAHYMIGESYYSAKDFLKAIQAFERVVTDFSQSEKVPPALFKLGVASAETGDAGKAREYLKRVIEKFPTSEEAKLARNKLAALR